MRARPVALGGALVLGLAVSCDAGSPVCRDACALSCESTADYCLEHSPDVDATNPLDVFDLCYGSYEVCLDVCNYGP